ncbi:MAG: PAS domain-containing protein, partial [Polyangiaceae bacterium]|nr:PAS domain-containing protein [Polyangiaceae bacterium]
MEAAQGDEPSPFGVETREQLLAEAERVGHIGSFAWHVPSDTSYWSDEFYRILGHKPRSIEPSVDAFFRAIHRGDLPRVLAAAERTVETGIGQSVDFRIVRPDGSVRHAHIDSAPIVDARGEATRVVGAVHDITERVEAEAEMRWRQQVFKQAQRIARVGSFEWNPWTGKTVWSEELHRICGIPLDEPGTQELYFSLVHPDDRPRLVQEAANVTPDRPVPPME